jgi:hypothetical protein
MYGDNDAFTVDCRNTLVNHYRNKGRMFFRGRIASLMDFLPIVQQALTDRKRPTNTVLFT